MGQSVNLIGQRFGRLITLGCAVPDDEGRKHYTCLCDCGQFSRVAAYDLKSGNTRSCGCLRSEVATRHGQAAGSRRPATPEYVAWNGMIQRCTNPKHHKFRLYGGRGIIVCQSWLESFEAFYRDMGLRPLGCTLDRKDNDGAYTKDNCRWTTRKIQQRNLRVNRLIEFRGETKPLSQWAEELGLNVSTVRNRLRRGLTGEKLFEAVTPGRA